MSCNSLATRIIITIRTYILPWIKLSQDPDTVGYRTRAIKDQTAQPLSWMVIPGTRQGKMHQLILQKVVAWLSIP